MNRKNYCACDSNFTKHYLVQAGGGFDDITVFKGQPYQRGYGFGSFLKRIGIPILKSFLRTGVDIGNDILSSRGVKATLKDRGKTGLKEAAKSGLNELSNVIDQYGSGIRQRRKRKRKQASKKTSKITPRRKKVSDIFQ